MIKKSIFSLVALSLLSTSSMVSAAGSAGKMLFVEGGLGFSHSFFRDDVVSPESHTSTRLGGSVTHPSEYYPNNYAGFYIGMSAYISEWLFNSRFDMYDHKEKSNSAAGTQITVAPVRLTFTADKVFGDINGVSQGLGAGVVLENTNKGSFRGGAEAGSESSHSIDGGGRIDPVVEGFVMKNLGNNLSLKLNVAYQVPAYSRNAKGDLNANLGVNYSFPI